MIDANNRIYDNTEYSGFINTNFFNVGIYLRLSRDDEGSTISESIINQRDFLIKYVKNQPNWVLTDIYQDDGYTGTNFNRPDFIRLKQDIEAGKINLVITKDLSRLGRDYIDTGYYIEKYFPEASKIPGSGYILKLLPSYGGDWEQYYEIRMEWKK